eukprot:TRINITY_DN1763_c0_g1_i6.p1 TRINITY_DN1763_c0_g1~~TRINITY_DN1763_c0_g1_i6.p1  ORF type:complete len:736 (+),score=253.34 TRINITY_DN1763_c0_g1_i6:151-2358(+)
MQRTTHLALVSLLLLIAGAAALYDGSLLVKRIHNAAEFSKNLMEETHVQVYVFGREDCERCGTLEKIVLDVADQLEGIANFYTVDCDEVNQDESNARAFPVCAEKHRNDLPHLTFFEPPYVRINPYTKQPMAPTEHRFPSGALTVQSLISFIGKISPAFRKSIKTQAEMEEFLSDNVIPGKVILFTSKKEPALLYKGLTMHYKDRLSFAEVHQSSQDIVQEFAVVTFPTLYVVKRGPNGVEEREIYQGDLKFPKLKKFLDPFALEERAERTPPPPKEEPKKEKPKEAPKPAITIHPVDSSTYEKLVLGAEKMVIVHFSRGENYTHLRNLSESLSGIAQVLHYNVGTEEDEDFVRKNYDVRSYPLLRVYPLGVRDKKNSRFFIKASMSLEEAVSEIYDSVDEKSKSLSEAEFQVFVGGQLTNKRFVILLAHEGQLPLAYKAVASLDKFKDTLAFGNFKNPSEAVRKQLQITTLPKLLVVFRQNVENMEDLESAPNDIQVAQFTGRIHFDEIKVFCDQFHNLLSGPTDRKGVDQARNSDEFDRLCAKKGGICLIGLLDGDRRSEEGKARVKNQTEVLKFAKDRLAGRPINFLWVDGKCQSELLMKLNIPLEYLPTAISYVPSKKLFSQLVGTLDKDGLRIFAENALKGRVSTNGIDGGSFDLIDRDCEQEYERLDEIARRASEASKEGSDLEDEILKEILEEERRKREALEAELESSGSSSKKRKGRKKKKGKKSEL